MLSPLRQGGKVVMHTENEDSAPPAQPTRTTHPLRSLPRTLSPDVVSRLIKDFLLSGKPAPASPVSIAVLTLLLAFRVEGDSSFSQLDLSRMLGCSVPTIRTALKTLSRLGWISQTQQAGFTKNLTVNVHKLPSAWDTGEASI